MPRKKKEEQKIPTTKSERRKALEKLMKQFNRKYDKEMIKFGKSIEKERERISFGLKALDKLTGGGIPVGLFTVIWGNKSVGKTTLVYKIIASAQEQDKIVAFFDLENTFDPDWASKMGVNVDDLVLGYFDTAEESLDALIAMAEERVVDLIVIDSIQALSPKGEQRNKSGTIRSIEEDEMALLARKLSKFFRISAPKINSGNIAVVMIGQARMDIGGFIALETLTGGKSLAHWASLIIRMRRGQKSDAPYERKVDEKTGKKKKVIIGFDCVFKLEKKKIKSAPEGTEVHLPFVFEEGFRDVDVEIEMESEEGEE